MDGNAPTETAVVDFVLPSLGSDMQEGTVIEWLVQAGDPVKKGDVLLRVDTEKSDIDVEVWQDAVVIELIAQPGETVEVGGRLARLSATDEDAPDDKKASSVLAPHNSIAAAESVALKPAAVAAPVTRSPIPHGDKSQPTRSTSDLGPRSDPRLVYWPSPTAAPRSEEPPSVNGAEGGRAERRQAAVAELMSRSNREIPHFHLTREIDLEPALAWLDAHNSTVAPPERILPAALLLHGVTKALTTVPSINGTSGDGPEGAPHVNLGVAVNLRGGGLVTPVLPEAEEMSLSELMGELRDAVTRARAGRMSSRDASDATLTVTNLGDTGVDQLIGVIQPPQRALVGLGKIEERPVVIDGAVHVRRTVVATLTADHRIVNGKAGGDFLRSLADVLRDMAGP